MLNIGIIGNTEVLEPHVKRIQKNKNVNVIGKSSVGTSAQLNGFHFSIPEFNRVELIERADLFLIDSSSLLPFDILCEIVKKSKHIFATEYLKLSFDECTRLLKLTNESGSVVQFTNPDFYSAPIQWLNKNLASPFYLDVSKYSGQGLLREALFPLLLMFADLTPKIPKKAGASAFFSAEKQLDFTNVRLEFNDLSVVNFNFGKQLSEYSFEIAGFAKDQNIKLDIKNTLFLLNNQAFDLSEYDAVSEFETFIDSTQKPSREKGNLEDYTLATQLLDTIEKKVAQF